MENTINQRIKLLRNELNYSQQDFAKRIGVSTLTVLRWEKDAVIPKKSIKKINEIFQVSMDWLIDGKGELKYNEVQLVTEDLNPWKDALVTQLKDENSFLKDQIKMMREMLQVLKPTANFPSRDVLAGTMYTNSMGISVSA